MRELLNASKPAAAASPSGEGARADASADAAETLQAAVDFIIKPKLEGMEPDPLVNARLKAAGFTQDQAQLVYDLAAEHLMPALREFLLEREHEFNERLVAQRHGGPEKWRALQSQMRAWAETNLPGDVYQQLSKTPDGIDALMKMMNRNEPALGGQGEAGAAPQNEDDLVEMMRDPRYWRKRDPAFIAKVAAGFKRLYPN